MFLVCYAQVYGAFSRTALLQALEDDLASSSDLRLRAALLALTLATGQPQLPGSGGLSMIWASTAVRWTLWACTEAFGSRYASRVDVPSNSPACGAV